MSDDIALRARTALGAFAPPLAGEALEHGCLSLSDSTTWEGSSGTIRGCRAVLAVPDEIHVKLLASPSTVDAITAAVARAVASEREVLADLVIEPGPHRTQKHPYR